MHINSVSGKQISIEEFYFLSQQIVSKLEDGHTSVNMPRSKIDSLETLGLLFPYSLAINDDNNLTMELSDLQNSKEIVQIDSINNVSADSLLMFFKSTTSSESIAFKEIIIERRLKRLLPLYFNFTENYSIILNNGRTINLTPPNIIQANEKLSDSSSENPEQENYTYYGMTDKTGVLELNSMVNLDSFIEFSE